MKRLKLPAPCHLCGQTCVSVLRGRVSRRMDRADLGAAAEPAGTEPCPWRQCPHRPHRRQPRPVIEDQTSHGVVAAPWPPTSRPPTVVSLHPDRGAAESDRRRLALAQATLPQPQPSGQPRIDYDVIEFPHAVIASMLDAAQEEGYEHGYEHGRDAAREERSPTPASGDSAQAALRDLAERHPALFADTARYLTGTARSVAAAVAEGVRLGHGFDRALARAQAASAAGRTP